ncbi:alcohol dehydrogenase catalytic domain-containing protein [candidate division WOR-3 bacterium]|nr:alcohol dehydrogenase catalytic domain-containing protein [candidate division WOR-3 bacterium]
MSKMKAVVKVKPERGGAELQDVDIPTIAAGEVLVKVQATSICGTDVHIYEWNPWAERRIGRDKLPQILGHEVAGEVVEVGPYVQNIKKGDYISSETHIFNPGDLQSLLGQRHIGKNMEILGVDRDGVFAEYVMLPERVCWINDRSIPPEFASVQEPLGNGVYAVLGEDADVAGKSMVIIGDGPTALFATGVARAAGVAKIILVGYSDFNMGLAKKMGADHVLDIKETSMEERSDFVLAETAGYGVDISLEMVGGEVPIKEALTHLRKGGRLTAFGVAAEAQLPIDYNNGIVFKGAQIHGVNGRKVFDTWYRMRNLLGSKRLDISPVVTHVMGLVEYEKGFEMLLAEPRKAAKIVLFPDEGELAAAKERMEEKRDMPAAD